MCVHDGITQHSGGFLQADVGILDLCLYVQSCQVHKEKKIAFVCRYESVYQEK